jgi:hypothetical protein
VTEVSTGVERRALTNESGYYVVPALSPGTYHITVEKDGFKGIRQSGIVLELEQTARLNFVLQLGEVTQAVEVTGEGALLQTNSALRADAFNLLNRPNFRLPSNKRGQADFGTISSTFDARSIALELRIVY